MLCTGAWGRAGAGVVATAAAAVAVLVEGALLATNLLFWSMLTENRALFESPIFPHLASNDVRADNLRFLVFSRATFASI